MSVEEQLSTLMEKHTKLLNRNEQLLKDLLKYGAHAKVCLGEKCVCGFDDVKEQALEEAYSCS